jgi:hypothetical protein
MHGVHRTAGRTTAGLLVLAAGFLLGGCGSMTSGTTVAKYTKGEDPGPPVAVDKAGTYALYYTTDTTPQVRTPVKEGDKVGFEQADTTGTYAAVAGEYRKVMDKNVYKAFWKKE